MIPPHTHRDGYHQTKQSVVKDVKKMEHLYTAGTGLKNSPATTEINVAVPQKKLQIYHIIQPSVYISKRTENRDSRKYLYTMFTAATQVSINR